MTAHLRRVGRRRQAPVLEKVSHHTVDRAHARPGPVRGVRRGKKLRTTIADPAAPARSPDLLERDFTAPAPNHRWVADFTYVRTWAGFVFVAFLVDVYAQRIVGWHAATTRTTEMVLTCQRMATWQREHDGHPILPGQLTQHHDAGSLYTSLLYTEHLAMERIADSVGSVGDAYDNALMESIIGLYKTECLRPGPFLTGWLKTVADVEFATMAWVDRWNNRRLHSSIGNIPPVEAEAEHYRQPTTVLAGHATATRVPTPFRRTRGPRSR
jgi:putative transposase